MTADFIFTTPVAQANITGKTLGSPLSIDLSSGVATVKLQSRTAASPIVGTDTTIAIQLTTADVQSILATITARGVATGVIAVGGTISVA